MTDGNQAEEPTEAEALKAAADLFSAKNQAIVGGPDANVVDTQRVEAVVQTETPGAVADTQPVEQAQSEDVAAMQARIEELTASNEDLKGKFTQSVGWARDLALRKSNDVAERDQLLRRIAAGEEVSREDISRFVSGQAQTVQPTYLQPPQQSDPTLDNLEASRFFVEHNVSQKEAERMNAWMRGPASSITNDDIVAGNPYQTMRLLYGKYSDYLNEQRSTQTTSVQSVARIQKAQARAAATPAGRAMPSTPPSPTFIDPAKDPQGFVDSGGFGRALGELMGR